MCDQYHLMPLSDPVTLRTEKIFGVKDSSKPYVGLEHIVSGQPIFMSMATAGASISANSIFYRGDVLFGKLRPNLRKSLPAPCDGYCSTDILVLQPNPAFDAGFVARVFQREEVFNEAVRTAEGTKMPRTSWKNLKNCCVYVPETNLEQHQIARILDTIDEAIQKTEQLIAKLKAIKQGLLHDLLTRGLDENGQLRDPVAYPEQFKDSPLGRIPKEWDYGPLKQFVDFMPGYGFPLELQGEIEGDFPFLKVRDMEISENSRYLIKANNYVNEKLVLKKGWKPVPSESVVFAKVGAALLLNRRRITIYLSLIDNNMMAVITKGEIIVNFLYWWMTRLDFAQLVQTTALPSVNQTQLGRVLIAFPKRQEDQMQIVSFIDSTDMLIENELAFLKKLQSLKKGLMHDLLTGKVRVNIPLEEIEHENRHDS